LVPRKAQPEEMVKGAKLGKTKGKITWDIYHKKTQKKEGEGGIKK